MKAKLLILLMGVLPILSYAQLPQAFKYQAVVRNNAGEILQNQEVGIRISIYDSTAAGTIVYQETFTETTNDFGLVNLEIGNGASTIGTFSAIDWGSNPKFLETEIDPDGGTAYVSIGTSELLSVPYALYSASSGGTSTWNQNGDDIYYENGNVGIGTDSPYVDLDIRSSSPASASKLQLGNSDVSKSLYLYSGNETYDPYISFSGSEALRFAKYDGTFNELMRIQDDGKVGIGTDNPTTELDVNGQIKITDGNQGVDKILTSDANGVATWAEPTERIDVGDYGTVVNPATGKTWLDRNLGASQVATASDDPLAYGDLYQWGRAQDGHEDRNSPTTTVRATIWLADEGSNTWDGKFITDMGSWLNTPQDDLWKGISAENNPCPSGFRIPTNAEWLQELRSWDSQDTEGAFSSPLKLPLGGLRDKMNGFPNYVGSYGYYWSSTVSNGFSSGLHIANYTGMFLLPEAFGYSVRCIKN